MEQSASDFNLKEWNLKPRSSCENTKLRRFSSSNFKSFRQDITTPTISSTVSSPGYTIREEIDPSTYSFTAAIKALQSKTVCSWEYLPQHKLTLHSKWSDAEKYISNPLSGEVPLECLSAKTLGSRSFSTLSNRITVSHLQHFHPIIQHQHHKLNITIQADEKDEMKKKCVTRDVGIQSTLPEAEVISSSSPSPIQTPSIEERSRKKLSVGESGDSSSSLCIDKEKPETEVEVEEREAKEKEGRKTKEGREKKKKKMMMMMMMMMCSKGGGRRGMGCLPLKLKGLWQREKSKPRKNNNNPKSSPRTFFHINACYDQ